MAENKSILSLVFAVEDNKLILKVADKYRVYEKRALDDLLRELAEREFDAYAKESKKAPSRALERFKGFPRFLLSAVTDVSMVYEEYKFKVAPDNALGRALAAGNPALFRICRLRLSELPKDKSNRAAVTAIRMLISQGIYTVGELVDNLEELRFTRGYGIKRFGALCDTLVKLGIDPATKGMLTS